MAIRVRDSDGALIIKVDFDSSEAERKLKKITDDVAKQSADATSKEAKATDSLKEAQVKNSKALTDAKIKEIELRSKNKAAIDAELVAQKGVKNNESIKNARELKDAQLASIEALRQSRLEIAKQKQDQAQLNQQYLQGKISTQEYTLAKRKQVDAEREAAKQARETKRALLANSEYNKLASALNTVRNQAKNTLAEMARLERQGYKNSAAYQDLARKSNALVSQTRTLDNQIKRIDATVGQHQRNVGNYGDAIGMVAPQLSMFAGRLGFVAAAVAAVNQSFTSNLRIEPINQALKVGSGTAQNFTKNMEFLRDITDRLGLEFISTAGAFKMWQGSAKFSNLTANETRSIFESVANAGAKMKLSNEQVEGTFLALSQMLSKGKVQAEELRGQLGERLPGSFALAAKAMGVTERELNKMLEKGEVVADVFLPRFAEQLDKSFGNDKNERIQGMQASINRLSNAFDSLWQSERASTFFSTVLDGLTDVTTEIKRLVSSSSWKELFTRLGGAVTAGANLITGNISGAIGAYQLGNRKAEEIAYNNLSKIQKDELQVKQMIAVFDKKSLDDKKKEYEIANRNLQGLAKQYEYLKKSNSLNESDSANLIRQNKLVSAMRSNLGLDDVSKKKETPAGLTDAEKKKREREAEQARQAVERQRKLQGEIDALAAQSNRNQLSRDEEEIESIKDKYAKMREEVRKFYADPKNKGLQVDQGKLTQAESFEISEAKTRQSTKELVKQLNEQRAIYDQYNAYVEQNGIDAAERMFGEQADIAKNYRAKLQQEYDSINALQGTQAQTERAKEVKQILDALNKDELAKQRAKYSEMLKLSEDNEIKIVAIRKKYSDAYEQLEKDKTTISAEEYQKRVEGLKKGQAEEIGAILLPDLQKGQDWVNVFDKTSTLARTKILQSVESLRASLKKMLDEGKITIDQYKDAIKGIKDVEVQVTVSERGFGRIKQILNELKEAEKGSIKHDEARQKLAGEISNIGGGLVEAGGDVLNIMDSLGIGSEKFKEDMALSLDLAGNAVNLAASIASGDVVGMITNGIKTISSAINLFTKDRKIERQIKEYQKQLEQLGKTYDEIAKKMSNSDANYYENSNAILKNLDDQERKIRQMMRAEDDKKKSGKEKMKAYDDQLKAIQNSREDLQKAIRDMRLQTDINTLSNNITNALVSAFEAGEDSIDNLDKAFDDFIKNAVANSLKLNLIAPVVEKMLGDLDKYMASNRNSLEGFDFENYKTQFGTISQELNKQLEAIYGGLGLEKTGSNNSSTISGKIQKELTEKTGGELLGIWRAGFDIWKQQLTVLQNHTAQNNQYIQIANNKLIALNAIQANTANTVSELKNAVVELKAINKNTSKTGRSAEGMGL